MIRAYPRRPTVASGTSVTLHVATDAPEFRVEFYRVGEQLSRVSHPRTEALVGHDYPDGPTDHDWGWPGYDFDVPADWASGAYIASLVTIDAAGNEHHPDTSTPDGSDAKALFVVHDGEPGQRTSILYKISWGTFHAYNATGYGSLYDEGVWARDHPNPGFKVTTRRPGGGTGGVVMLNDSPDYYDTSSRRQTFSHWDWPMIRWLEKNGYSPDYCTDLDVHQDAQLLGHYNLLLSVGHDEYWSAQMRAHIDEFVASGGNVAYFSGNIDGWRIHFHDDDTSITCAKTKPGIFDIDSWETDYSLEADPEARTTGVSINNGGGWWDGKRDALGYTVQHCRHWIYNDTGLADGDVFGDDDQQPLVGYECDGAQFIWRDGLAIVTGAQGTPSDFFILGLAPLTERWHANYEGAAATMGTFTSTAGGIVFQGATTDWPLSLGHSAQVAQITRNVIDRLQLPSVRLMGPLPGRAGRMTATVGETARFHVDHARLSSSEGLTYAWERNSEDVQRGPSPTLALELQDGWAPVTVSVTVYDGEQAVAFGTRTFVTLTADGDKELEVINLLREIVTPGNPTAPMVFLSRDPMIASRDISTVNLAWIRDRAARLAEVCEALVRDRTADGTRQLNVDHRRSR